MMLVTASCGQTALASEAMHCVIADGSSSQSLSALQLLERHVYGSGSFLPSKPLARGGDGPTPAIWREDRDHPSTSSLSYAWL